MRAFLLPLLLCAPLVFAAPAQPPVKGKTSSSKTTLKKPGPSGPGLPKMPEAGAMKPYRTPPKERFRLSNGLEVLLVEDHRFPLLSVRLAVRGGTALAGARDAGLVDALAELLTAGTSKRGAKEIAQEADAFGGSLDAQAMRDYLVLEAFSLSERAGRMLDLLAETALDPVFPEAEVELRKTNMVSELKVARSQPAFLAGVAFNKKLYGRHPYAVTAPTEESIARIHRGALQVLHKKLFVTANSTLVAAGDIRRSELEPMLEARFSSWKPLGELPAAPLPPAREPGGEARRIVFVERPGSAQSVLQLGNLALSEDHPDYFKLLVANQALGGSFAARLMTDLREHKGYTYGIYSRLPSARSGGAFVVKTQVRNEVTAPAIEAILGHLRRMREELLSPEELRQAKNTLAGRFVRGLETQQGVADALLHGLMMGLPEDRLDVFVGKVQEVSAEEVREAARLYFHPETLLLSVVGDPSMRPAVEKFSPYPVQLVDENGDNRPDPR
ncbi:MAG: pitrilysin family protein [Elusimicrobiota bacterium]